MTKMSGSRRASTSGASSSRPRGWRASGSSASGGASNSDDMREGSASPGPAIPREKEGNYSGHLLSEDHICNCDDFEDGDSHQVMWCG